MTKLTSSLTTNNLLLLLKGSPGCENMCTAVCHVFPGGGGRGCGQTDSGAEE